jgi:hypothetical protein
VIERHLRLLGQIGRGSGSGSGSGGLPPIEHRTRGGVTEAGPQVTGERLGSQVTCDRVHSWTNPLRGGLGSRRRGSLGCAGQPVRLVAP